MNQPSASLAPVGAAGPAGHAGPVALVPPLARLPLQIGTTATWSAARAALTLFPGLALAGCGVFVGIGSQSALAGLVVAVPGILLVVFAATHLKMAVTTRASDLLLYPDGVLVDGGRLHGHRIGWRELQPPYAELEDTTTTRLTLWRILIFVLSMLSRSRTIYSPMAPVRIWRLHVWQAGQRRLIAETERPIERDSMMAAATSMTAVVQGQRYVEQAPAIAQHILLCPSCGGPAVPDETPTVTCSYCRVQIPMPPQLQQQAAGVKAMARSRATTTQMIDKLRRQPRATRSNAWLLIFTVFMFGAWPIGWGIIAYRVLGDGFQPLDTLCLMLPLAAVLGGFFLARGRLADRGALQMLTLGFGALAPARDGEPSRCRRCQGPLPNAGTGGVSPCAYCGAENIVGLDLRPSLDPARTEQYNFDGALQKRSKEKALWTVLTVVAVIALAGWVVGTVFYVIGQDVGTTPAPAATARPAPPAAPPATPARPATPAPAPGPAPHPAPTKPPPGRH